MVVLKAIHVRRLALWSNSYLAGAKGAGTGVESGVENGVSVST